MTDAIKALIFAPGLPPGGKWGTLVVRITGIEVTVSNARGEFEIHRATLTDLSCREIGFGKPGVELAWHTEGKPYAAHVLDPELATQLVSHPVLDVLPAVQALKSNKRKVNAGRALGWSTLGLIVALPLLLIALFFWQADRIAGWVADQIPIEEEVKLGKQSFESMKAQLKLQDSGPAYEAVQSIGKRLTEGSKYSYEFHVVQDDTLNAFAMPGGIVVVHTGLIAKTKRPEELAGVLAHEVQHVEQRHSLEGMVKNLGLYAVWAMLTGDIGGTLAGQAAVQLTSLKFSRDAETEADQKGFDTLVAKGIDPAGMPEFFQTMSKEAADAPAAFMSTHPLSKDREAQLQQRVSELKQKEFNKLEMGKWPPG